MLWTQVLLQSCWSRVSSENKPRARSDRHHSQRIQFHGSQIQQVYTCHFISFTRRAILYIVKLFVRTKKRISKEEEGKLWEMGRVVPVKGSRYIVVCRGFVDFVIHDVTAQKIKDLLRHTRKPLYVLTERHNYTFSLYFLGKLF